MWWFRCSFLSNSGASLPTRGGSVSLFTAIKFVPRGASRLLSAPLSNQQMIRFDFTVSVFNSCGNTTIKAMSITDV